MRYLNECEMSTRHSGTVKVQGIIPIMRSYDRVLARPAKPLLLAIRPFRRMNTHTLVPPVPTIFIIAEPTKHDDLASNFAQRRHPIVQIPHIFTAGPLRDFLLNEHRERRVRRVFLFDRHHDRLSSSVL